MTFWPHVQKLDIMKSHKISLEDLDDWNRWEIFASSATVATRKRLEGKVGEDVWAVTVLCRDKGVWEAIFVGERSEAVRIYNDPDAEISRLLK